jgi:hypothetical protein
MAQDLLLAQTRIKGEEDIRQREIARQQALDEAEIAAREAVERMRILQDAQISEARIAEDQADPRAGNRAQAGRGSRRDCRRRSG